MSSKKSGRGFARCIVAATGGCLVPISFGATFNFTTDPVWDELNNRSAPQNYGFSNTDHTGAAVSPPGGIASGAGEIGGVIRRAGSPANYYAYNLGTSLSINDAFSASGVI